MNIKYKDKIINPVTLTEVDVKKTYGKTNEEFIYQAIDRYLAMIEVGNYEVKKFTNSEMNLLYDVSMSHFFDSFSMFLENHAFLMLVEDAEEFSDDEYFGEDYYKKWNVDKEKFKLKLENLSKPGQIALLDSVEKFRAK